MHTSIRWKSLKVISVVTFLLSAAQTVSHADVIYKCKNDYKNVVPKGNPENCQLVTSSQGKEAIVSAGKVPTKLFGVTLGGKYDVGDHERATVGTLPIEKVTGIGRSFSNLLAVNYFFKPLDAPQLYVYREIRDHPDDQSFRTSFRLYLLPVIPSTIQTLEKFDKTAKKYEVILIDWKGDLDRQNAYYWASDLCITFEIDLKTKPQIMDDAKDFTYQCTFTQANRELRVSSFEGGTVALGFSPKVFDQKQAAVELIRRKLEANEVRPY